MEPAAVLGAVTLLVAPVVLGAHPAGAEKLSGVFLEMEKAECQFLNGSERVRFVDSYIHNREQYVHFDSDLGIFVADTPLGERQAQHLNSLPEFLEQKRAEVDTFCRSNYKAVTSFAVERRAPGADPPCAVELPAPEPQAGLCRDGFLPRGGGGEVVQERAGGDGEPGVHGGAAQRGLDLPGAGAAGKQPAAWGHLPVPGGAQQPAAPHQPALGAAGRAWPQQDADRGGGLGAGAPLPGPGALPPPAQQGLLKQLLPLPPCSATGCPLPGTTLCCSPTAPHCPPGSAPVAQPSSAVAAQQLGALQGRSTLALDCCSSAQ
ncbi:uncharacterized protein [Melanerpes formicivorus]|uniref:uncharacterized protein isoform X1 n=1 Tax=Melanerpes formicivorus TaxID=211600 RepID=UPI00358E99FD